MPWSQTPVVSWRKAAGCFTGFSLSRTAAFRTLQNVGFHRHVIGLDARLILRTTTIQISGLHNAACLLATPSFTHPLPRVVAAKPTADLDETYGGGFMQPDVWVGLVYQSMD